MRLHHLRRGSGDPIVFLHGLGTSAASWEACAISLSDRYLTIAIDLLGHGHSPVPDDPSEYSRDATLEEIDALLADLGDAATQTVLVGHSLGGYLALAHAATRPGAVRGIAVTNTGPGFRDAEKREAWNDRTRRNASRFGVPEQVTNLNLQQDSIVMDRLAEITTPTIVIVGGDDRPEYQGSASYLVRKMRDARSIVIDGGGHSMHEDTHADVVAAHIAEFIGGLG